MGDMSVEPSMEEILSSIKRIIAEEGDGPTRGRRLSRPAPPPRDDDREVLELSDPMPEPVRPDFSRAEASFDRRPDPAPVEPTRIEAARVEPIRPEPQAYAEPEPAPRIEVPRAETPRTETPRSEAPRIEAPRQEPVGSAKPPAAEPEPIISASAAEASRGSLENLSRLLVKPDPASDGTLEGLVRDMLRPMLRDWLDRNLPAMVETMVADEIARITGQPR